MLDGTIIRKIQYLEAPLLKKIINEYAVFAKIYFLKEPLLGKYNTQVSYY
jgi:hypothetical protein